MERYICIHGHFYQPPRENPWLEAIELQDSAYPYHDWNERIVAECYAPNMAARILDGDGRIERIQNNYTRISFNFGPTLAAWLKDKAPDAYSAILAADRDSQRICSGHGSALAQAYNHVILPLANARDKRTQLHWGIRDFQHRFNRWPEGMWLPETAVDLETLELLAEFGIKFTILAPHQASRVRQIGGRAWKDVSGGRIDPSHAYRISLRGGRKLALFFYDGPISRAVAFEGLLDSGERFARRLLEAFDDERTWPQLVHIATDGETYGHHHKHGEMALAYALQYIEANGLARLTNYGEYLEKHAPTHEVQIVENTAWSCSHGIERWRSNCGCNTGRLGWTQEWRTPLLEALYWLRDTLAPLYEDRARLLLKNPWAARDDYIEVILDRSSRSVDNFFSRHTARRLDDAERTTALRLLELQRHSMLMFTSCGWFFDELSGIETVQAIQYAGRALQLAAELFGEALEEQFLARIEKAGSNISEYRDGRRIYEKFVRPAMVDLPKVGAHYAVSSLFEQYPDTTRIYCYTAERQDAELHEAGRAKFFAGRARLISEITGESADLSFAVLHMDDHILTGGVRRYQGDGAYEALVTELNAAFARADFPELIRLLDKHFAASTYSLRSLFRDEQRKILDVILGSTLAETEALYQQVYEHNVALMRVLGDLRTPLPRALHAAAEFALNGRLRGALASDDLNLERIRGLLEEARLANVALDSATLEFTFRKNLERLALDLRNSPGLEAIDQLDEVLSLVPSLPFEVNLWAVQNIWFELLDVLARFATRGDDAARNWVARFHSLAEKLRIRAQDHEAVARP